jgi:putative ABC transport system substrate-binding protein
MRRREFITLLGGAAAWPLVARAQQPSMPVIGFLQSGGPSFISPMPDMVAAFQRGLKEVGFVKGQNVGIVYHYADGQYDRLPALAANLIRNRVAVIFAGGPPAALAAKAATSTIPIVFTTAGDPVKAGLVASFNRPGGNVTGFSFFVQSTVTKKIELLRELVPNAVKIGILVNPNFPGTAAEVAEGHAAERSLGLELPIIHASNDDQLEAAFADMEKQRLSALVVQGDIFFTGQARDEVIALAARHAIPAIYDWHHMISAGGLMSYGTSVTDGYRQAGNYVGQILKGARPSDLPVQQPTKFELVINLKTAKALGLDIPPALLARADEVIE